MAVARAGAPDRWEGAHLLGQLHLERGDLDAALPLLRAAAAAGDDPEVTATLRLAEAGELAGGFAAHDLNADGGLSTVAGDEGLLTAAAVSTDGKVAMIARVVRHPVPRTLRTWLFGYRRPQDEHPVHVVVTAPHRVRTLPVRGVVSQLDLTADGRLAATSTADAVELWDVAGGVCLHSLTGHRGYVSSVRFSPDGRVVASAGLDDRILVRDVTSGRCLWALTAPDQAVRSLGFSADGAFLASAGDDRTLRLWDLRTGRCVQALTHPDRLRAVGLSGDARTAVAGGDALHVWDLTTGERRFVLGGPVEDVWSHDGVALTGDRDGEIRLWDLVDGRCLRTFGGHRDAAYRLLTTNEALRMPLRIDEGGRRVHSVGNNQVVRSWGLPTGYRAPLRLCRPRPHATVRELDERVRALVDAGLTAIADGRLDQALTSLSAARELPGHETDATVVAAWRRLSRATERTGLRSAWLGRVIELPVAPGSFWTPAAAVSGDGRLALTTCFQDPAMVMWDLDTGRTVHEYTVPGHPIHVTDLDMNADATLAVTGDGYREVRLWDLRDGTHVRTLGEPDSSRMSLAVDRAGRVALVERGDGVLRLWDLSSDRVRRTFHGRRHRAHYAEGPSRRVLDEVNGVALGPDGRVVVAALRLGGVVCWHGRRRRRLAGHTGRVDVVRVSADGRFAVTGGWDATVRYWELATGRCRQVMTGPTHPVVGADLTADGRFALSASRDDTVRIWDLATGRCAQVLDGISEVTEVRVAGDGTRAVTVGGDRLLRVWELDWALAVPRSEIDGETG